MRVCLVRKVPYRLPGSSRLVWSLILAEREGLTLLLVPKTDDNRSHAIVVATENVPERVYESVNASTFPAEPGDLAEIGSKLQALGDDMAKADIAKMFEADDLW